MACNLGYPCDDCRPGCPEHMEKGEERIVCYCYRCDKAILEGDTYYDIDNEPYCAECIANAEREA